MPQYRGVRCSHAVAEWRGDRPGHQADLPGNARSPILRPGRHSRHPESGKGQWPRIRDAPQTNPPRRTVATPGRDGVGRIAVIARHRRHLGHSASPFRSPDHPITGSPDLAFSDVGDDPMSAIPWGPPPLDHKDHNIYWVSEGAITMRSQFFIGLSGPPCTKPSIHAASHDFDLIIPATIPATSQFLKNLAPFRSPHYRITRSPDLQMVQPRI